MDARQLEQSPNDTGMTYTSFCSDARIWCRDHGIPKGNVSCSLETLNTPRQMKLLGRLRLAPRSEVAHLSVITVISKKHFGTNEQDFPIQANDSTIVSNVSMLNGHCPDRQYTFKISGKTRAAVPVIELTSNVQQNIIARCIRQDSFKHFPTCQEQVLFPIRVGSAIGF